MSYIPKTKYIYLRVCVCVHMREHESGLFLRASLCVCGVHVYKADIDVGCLPQFGLHILFFEKSLTEPRAH